MKDTNSVVLAIVAAVVIGGVAFFSGMHVTGRFALRQPAYDTKQKSFQRGFGMQGGMMNGAADSESSGFRGRMGNVGEITNVNGKTVTLKLPDGTSKDVVLESDAVVNITTKGTVKDLTVGQTIMVSGGGFWNRAQTVIIRP